MKQIGAIYRSIAKQAECAVLLVHHTRKNSQGMAGDMDVSRGASALSGICRVMSTLFNMSREDAKMYNVEEDERHRFVRFDGAKANLSLTTNRAKWFRRVSVDIPNGDQVGALEKWTPPHPYDDIVAADCRGFQVRINTRSEAGDAYGPKNNCGENWAGYALCDQLKRLELTVEKNSLRLQAIIDGWEKDKYFKIRDRKNANHMVRKALLVDQWVKLEEHR